MTFVTKGDFSLEDHNRVIKKYKFPITDLKTAVQFLNELPKNYNVDLPHSIKYCNLHSAQSEDAEYNLTLLCNNSNLDKTCFRVHAIFQDIIIVTAKDDKHKFVVIRSSRKSTATDLYLADDVVILNPTTSDVYDVLYSKIINKPEQR